MNIRRYVAKEMRLALNQVREEQGPDAVILSSRRVGDGVEVVVAVDYEADAAQSAADIQSALENANADSEYGFMQALERTRATEAGAAAGEMSSELNALRRMLETQLATLAWNDLTRRAPVHTEVLKELSKIGVTPTLAAEFVSQLPARCELREAQRMALALFSHRIPTAPERWLEHGGMIALLGPTGVGKTSTLAKIAARWVLRHGARELALVSADTTRIGAQDHIQTIGRLLGAPCYLVEGIDSLGATLADLRHRKLVLVDTAGLSQRDARLQSDLAMLRAAHADLECTLVLSASAQAGAIEETLQRFAPAQPASCVLTKIDEAASLGGALSAIVMARLPIVYLCDGQRVAEDIKPARAHQLVASALQLARNAGATADEDLLSRRFGGISHAIA